MYREVITSRDAERLSAPTAGLRGTPLPGSGLPTDKKAVEPDRYVDRLMKYIPAEVVALYIFLDGLIQNAPVTVPRGPVSWFVFLFLLGGTWLYLQRVQRVNKRTQLIISTVAFALWVFYLGGPFALAGWYERFYGTLALPLYTFVVALIESESNAR